MNASFPPVIRAKSARRVWTRCIVGIVCKTGTCWRKKFSFIDKTTLAVMKQIVCSCECLCCACTMMWARYIVKAWGWWGCYADDLNKQTAFHLFKSQCLSNNLSAGDLYAPTLHNAHKLMSRVFAEFVCVCLVNYLAYIGRCCVWEIRKSALCTYC